MDNKGTRLRSQVAARPAGPTENATANKEAVKQRNDIVEVEVEEGEHDRDLPVIRGVNKRKRDPRGAGRRLQQKPNSQEDSVSVFVQENADVGSLDDIKESELYDDSKSPEEQVLSGLFSAVGVSQPPLNTYVIIPDIMAEDQTVMKQLDKRRESSRLRVRPSKFREGFLLGDAKPKGDQKGADEGTSSFEIVLPMDFHHTAMRRTSGDSNPKASMSRAAESDGSLEISGQTSVGKSKFKITYKLGSAKSTERQRNGADSASSFKNGFDEHGLKTALAVVKRVMQIKSADPFNEPVDAVALEIPDYFDVIKEPMDLGTIREYLEAGKKYRTVPEVYADVQLVWRNCRSYNQEGDPIMDILKIAETVFNKHWSAAGLQVSLPDVQMKEANNNVEPSDELVVTSAQRSRDELKRRKLKDAKPNLQRNAQFDNLSPRLKVKRSASVEHVMAESKAREDKLEFDGVETFEGREVVRIDKEDSNVSRGHCADEVAGKEHAQPVAVGVQGPDVNESSQAEQQTNDHKYERMKVVGGQPKAELHVKQDKMTEVEEKNNLGRGSSSQKRRTFGTVHHKPDCTCVVCVGRRRKLAREEMEGREEREGKEGTRERKEHKKSRTGATQQSVQDIETHVTLVDKASITAQPPEAVMETVALSVETVNAESDRPSNDSETLNSPEVETVVEGVRYFPANHEVPLRKLNPTLLNLSGVLFGYHHSNVWKRHHALGFRLPPSMSTSSMLQAVHSLTLSER